MSARPLAIDLYCGLGGWTEGLISEGFDVIGFDVEQHVYGEHRYPAQLVLQDVRTINGAQFRDASLIVASSPCQKYSYMAMPWSRAKALATWYRDAEHPERLLELNELFEQPARIQREACEAAGRFIPMIQENVKGAQPWIGRARWHFGSYYLWGDVPALMPTAVKAQKFIMDDIKNGQRRQVDGIYSQGLATKNAGGSWFNIGSPGQTVVNQNPVHEGTKTGHWFGDGGSYAPMALMGSKSKARKAASARIAKIPLPLAAWIGHCYHPARLVA